MGRASLPIKLECASTDRRVREVGKAQAWKEEERKNAVVGPLSVDESEKNLLNQKESVTQVFVENQEATSLSVNPPTHCVRAR